MEPFASASRQPFLHHLVTGVAAPGLVLTSSDGRISGGVEGWYVDDVRLLSRLELGIRDADLELVRSDASRPDEHATTHVVRRRGPAATAEESEHHDPTLLVDQRRVLTSGSLALTIRVTSTAQAPTEVELRLDLASDLAPIALVRRGESVPLVPAYVESDRLVVGDDRRGTAIRVQEGTAPAELDDAGITWRLRLDRGTAAEVGVVATAAGTPRFGSGRPAPWSATSDLVGDDPRPGRLWRRSLADLEGLLLRDGDDPFLAAGSPWFLTLFGRDSLWAARLLLPLGTDLALSTLRVLARRQGTRDDPATEEQPGKILHELRRTDLEHGLPPLYYGTVDATALFVCLLADAHRWGADPDQVRALLPAARACLAWVMEQSAKTGWLRYVDRNGSGLSNHGWKDSPDSVQFADGRLADAPIALCEVQGYAHEAAVAGAALLAAYGEPEVPGLLAWAEDLRRRFRAAFWVDTAEGGHPAIALDGEGRRVDAVTSNLGHLLGTGILGAADEARIAELLVDPRLRSGFGVRTLTSASPRYARLSYHGGSVWPHDTAIAIRGLAATGHLGAALRLTSELVTAAEGMGYRLPELYGGDAADDVPAPTAYPAACRPQAWSAAGAIAALVASTGLEVDLPRGVLRVSPVNRGNLGLVGFRIDGLRAGEDTFSVSVATDGEATLHRTS